MSQPGYAIPRSVQEAVETLARSTAARPIAGGTDLMVQMRLGHRRPDVVVDTRAIEELHLLRQGDPTVIGAAVTLRRFLGDAELTGSYPALAQAANLLGGRQIQAVATFGGNVCNASPAAETATPLLVYAAQAVIESRGGRREVPLTAFFTGPGKTVVDAGELLVGLHLPPPTGDERSAYRRLELRRSVDIAVVSASSWVRVVEGRIATARVAVGAVNAVAMRVPAAEATLTGVEVDDSRAVERAIAQAAVDCRDASRPIDDTRASAQYRLAMVELIARRALNDTILTGAH
ncbi:FAD binding domain-containing protein [Nocardioides sp. LHD-245]|uniref:FAD binding domain-containing protein n=1 Tax=Nocardioides sp. LHD-245 TaxID=3051387 RepID=UPI0027E05C8F|nr:FAD binding domain-containing protein [Nocardioides sp. LHD-245]